MKDINDKNFGVIIAFWLPGFILLWGLSLSFDEVAKWLAQPGKGEASIAGFLLWSSERAKLRVYRSQCIRIS
jgi:hypothetical protein